MPEELSPVQPGLSADEEKLRLLFELLPVGISILDREGNILVLNPALERLLGLSREEILNQTYTRRQYIKVGGTKLSPEEFPSVRAVTEQRTIENVEIGVIKEDGEIIWTNVSAVPVDLPDWQVVVVTSDITRRKSTEEALRRERDLLDRLMETSPVGITVVNRAGRITFANATAEKILGLARTEITQLSYNDPAWQITDYDGRSLPDEALPFRQVMTTGQPVYDVRHAILWPSGSRKLLSINAAPLFDHSGGVDGLVATIEDVTERIEEEQRQNQALNQKLQALDLLSAPPQTAITAQMFGQGPLHATLPEIFAELVQLYGELIDFALEQRVYKVEYPISDSLRAIAQRLGVLQAGPRDLVEIHSVALRQKIAGINAIKARVYAEESQLIALELMGYLTSFYRNHALGNHKPGTLENPAAAKE